ncbi:MAG: Lrp/AsnC ligand binding domain-containing protein [Candidatus Bathyarchaeota archaeon]|nr:Lrp/AsnC ligand binding domain-containing protein [Candidatus Bathyarchaeota archaeon]
MPIKAYMLLNVSSGSEKEVCKKISDFDEVLDASIVYGEFDIIVKVSVEDLDALETLSEKIRTTAGVMMTSTMIVAREYKGRVIRNSLKIENLK